MSVNLSREENLLMVIAHIVRKDSAGRMSGASPVEAIDAVLRINPTRLPDILEGLRFTGVRGIPFAITKSLGAARGLSQGMTYEIRENTDRSSGTKKALSTPKSNVSGRIIPDQMSWSRGSTWLTVSLLEIVEFISFGRRFEIKYALHGSEKYKEKSGKVNFERADSAKPGLNFDLIINDQERINFLDVSSLQLTKLE